MATENELQNHFNTLGTIYSENISWSKIYSILIY